MIIALDAFGGDNAPVSNLMGGAAAAKKGSHVIFTGDRQTLLYTAEKNGIDLSGTQICHAPSVFPMDSIPEDMLSGTGDTSLEAGLKLLSEGTADAFVSAGSTGAIILGGIYYVKRIRGVKKPAIGAFVPTLEGKTFLIDCGANISCTPEDILCFAKLASVYLSRFFGMKTPSAGLLNIGTEKLKGTELYKESHSLLSQVLDDGFAGNIEARQIPFSAPEIITCDGFTGNIFLKTYEGAALAVMKGLKDVYNKNKLTRLSGAVIKNDMRAFKNRMSSSETGGAPVLGLRKPVIKAHGSSDAAAIENAVLKADEFCKKQVCNELIKAFSEGF